MKNTNLTLIAIVAAVAVSSAFIVGFGLVPTTTDLATASQVKAFKHTSNFDRESLQAYVAQKSAALKQMSSTTPDKQIQVAVSFKKPMTQTEIDSIKLQHGLEVEYFEYVAGNNITGGAATRVYADLNQISEYLKSSRNVEAIGVTYIYAHGKTVEFQKLNENPDVVLVDVGFINEIENANAQGNIGTQDLPPNLYQWHKKFG